MLGAGGCSGFAYYRSQTDPTTKEELEAVSAGTPGASYGRVASAIAFQSLEPLAQVH